MSLIRGYTVYNPVCYLRPFIIGLSLSGSSLRVFTATVLVLKFSEILLLYVESMIG